MRYILNHSRAKVVPVLLSRQNNYPYHSKMREGIAQIAAHYGLTVPGFYGYTRDHLYPDGKRDEPYMDAAHYNRTYGAALIAHRVAIAIMRTLSGPARPPGLPARLFAESVEDAKYSELTAELPDTLERREISTSGFKVNSVRIPLGELVELPAVKTPLLTNYQSLPDSVNLRIEWPEGPASILKTLHGGVQAGKYNFLIRSRELWHLVPKGFRQGDPIRISATLEHTGETGVFGYVEPSNADGQSTFQDCFTSRFPRARRAGVVAGGHYAKKSTQRP